MDWSIALRCRPCYLCKHDQFDHSMVLVGEPCLDCDCPGFIPIVRPNPSIPMSDEERRDWESLL